MNGKRIGPEKYDVKIISNGGNGETTGNVITDGGTLDIVAHWEKTGICSVFHEDNDEDYFIPWNKVDAITIRKSDEQE